MMLRPQLQRDSLDGTRIHTRSDVEFSGTSKMLGAKEGVQAKILGQNGVPTLAAR